MERRMVCASLLGMAVALSSFPTQAASSAPVLGTGHGLDHVGIAVQDLQATARDFERLGFNVQPGGRFPGGLSNAVIFIGPHFYLELLAAAPDHTKDVADVADFAAKHEGAMFLGLNVSSAKNTAAWLRSRNFDASGPDPGSIMTGDEKKLPPPEWYTVAPADTPAKGKRTYTLPIFFIQYLNENSRAKQHAKKNTQPNTAISARAVWFLTKEVGSQLRLLKEGGFGDASPEVSLEGLHGQGVTAGVGVLELLEYPSDSKSLPVDDNGIAAVSLQVEDLAKARKFAESATGNPVPIYAGSYGSSIFIPPDKAHGLGIELFQQ